MSDKPELGLERARTVENVNLFRALRELRARISQFQEHYEEFVKASRSLKIPVDWRRVIPAGQQWSVLAAEDLESLEEREESILLPSRALAADRPETEVEELRRQVQILEPRAENLESRVKQERVTAARETQRYDQLLVQFGELQARCDTLIDRLNERARANDALQAALIAREGGRLRMFETYQGAVKHVHGDSVVVVFEVDDDLVERTYQRGQFIDGRVPAEDENVAVYVHLATLPREDDKAASG